MTGERDETFNITLTREEALTLRELLRPYRPDIYSEAALAVRDALLAQLDDVALGGNEPDETFDRLRPPRHRRADQ